MLYSYRGVNIYKMVKVIDLRLHKCPMNMVYFKKSFYEYMRDIKGDDFEVEVLVDSEVAKINIVAFLKLKGVRFEECDGLKVRFYGKV